MTVPARVTVHIDQVVVEGLPAGQRAAFGDGLRVELSRLLAASPRLGPARRERRRTAPGIDVVADPEAAGRNLAHAVFAALIAEARDG